MAVKTYTFTLDLSYTIPVPTMLVRLGDYDTTTFNVTVTNGGEPFDLTGWTPQFEARFANGSYIKDDGKQFKNLTIVDAKGGVISYTLVSEAFSTVGTVEVAYFSFTKPDASLQNPIDIVSTRNFKYKVISDAATGAIGVAEHYISQIEILEWQVKESVANMESKVAATIKNTENKTNAAISNMEKKVNDTVASTVQKTDATIKDVQTKVDKTLTDTTNKVNTSITAFDKKINDFIAKLDGQMKDFETRLTALETQIKNLDVVKKSGDTMTGTLTSTSDIPLISKKAGKKSWTLHHPDQDLFILAPSKTANGTDWDWDNGIKFLPDGNINLHGNNVVTHAYLVNFKQKHKVTEDNGTNILIAKGTDLNTIKNAGFYRGEALTNAPTAEVNKWWFVDVQKHDDSWVMQRATDFNMSLPRTYARFMYQGTWKPWIDISNSDEISKKVSKTGDTMTGALTIDMKGTNVRPLRIKNEAGKMDVLPYNGDYNYIQSGTVNDDPKSLMLTGMNGKQMANFGVSADNSKFNGILNATKGFQVDGKPQTISNSAVWYSTEKTEFNAGDWCLSHTVNPRWAYNAKVTSDGGGAFTIQESGIYRIDMGLMVGASSPNSEHVLRVGIYNTSGKWVENHDIVGINDSTDYRWSRLSGSFTWYFAKGEQLRYVYAHDSRGKVQRQNSGISFTKLTVDRDY
ncbi:BppU family phage baseplate upper protein [Bacillus thuringiensis]